jgi:hypothetical protein
LGDLERGLALVELHAGGPGRSRRVNLKEVVVEPGFRQGLHDVIP